MAFIRSSGETDYRRYPDEDNKRLRELLLSAIEKRGITRRQAAKEMGLSQRTVYAFLTGENGAGRGLIVGMAKWLGELESDLLGKHPDGRRLGDIPGFWEMVEENLRTSRRGPDRTAYLGLSQLRSLSPIKFTPQMLEFMAMGWERRAENDELMAVEEQDIREKLEAARATPHALPTDGNTALSVAPPSVAQDYVRRIAKNG